MAVSKCEIYPSFKMKTESRTSIKVILDKNDCCVAYPKMTAFQNMMLLSHGAPLMPAGGSCRISTGGGGFVWIGSQYGWWWKGGIETERAEKQELQTFCSFLKSRMSLFRAGVDMANTRRYYAACGVSNVDAGGAGRRVGLQRKCCAACGGLTKVENGWVWGWMMRRAWVTDEVEFERRVSQSQKDNMVGLLVRCSSLSQ